MLKNRGDLNFFFFIKFKAFAASLATGNVGIESNFF